MFAVSASVRCARRDPHYLPWPGRSLLLSELKIDKAIRQADGREESGGHRKLGGTIVVIKDDDKPVTVT